MLVFSGYFGCPPISTLEQDHTSILYNPSPIFYTEENFESKDIQIGHVIILNTSKSLHSDISSLFSNFSECQDVFWSFHYAIDQKYNTFRIPTFSLSKFNMSSKSHYKINFDDEILVYNECGLWIYNPRKQKSLDQLYSGPVTDAHKCQDFLCFIDEAYHLCRLDENMNKNLITLDGREIGKCTKLSGGYNHVCVLTITGSIYTYGIGTKGQLGCGHVDIFPDEAYHVSYLENVKITDVACGGWHTLALSDCNDIYSWGWNDFWQIGIQEPSVIAEPHLLDIKDQNGSLVDFVKIAAGSQHSVAIDTNGQLWGWGSNNLYQMGSYYGKRIIPTHIQLSENKVNFTDVKCGRWTTIIFL